MALDEWNHRLVSDRMRRLLAQCEDEAGAARWLGPLEELCRDLSAVAPDASDEERRERCLVLLQAAPFFSLQGRWREYLQLAGPFLDHPSKALVDEVYLGLTDPILQTGQWGTIADAVDVLEEAAARSDTHHFWVAYAKTLSSTVNALYSLGRLSTAESFVKRFDRIPARFREVTDRYHALTLEETVRAQVREGSRAAAERALDDCRELFRNRPTPPLRDAFAATSREVLPAYLEDGDVDACTSVGETLWEMTLAYPRESELAVHFQEFLRATLPRYFEEGQAGPYLQRFCKLVKRHGHEEAVGVRAAVALSALGEQLGEEERRELVPVLRELERRGRKVEAIRERTADLCAAWGLTPRRGGCLGVALLGLISGLGAAGLAAALVIVRGP